MQQSHHQGIFHGSTRFTPVQSLPVRPGIVPGSQKYICSPIMTVHYGLPRSTHVNTRSNKSGSSQFHPGGHPVHPGQHTVDTRFIPVNTRLITVPYGSLRCLTVHPGQHTVHYGSLRCPRLRFIVTIPSTPGSLRFITVHPGQHPVLPGQHPV